MRGKACIPRLLQTLPLAVGDLQPGTSATVNLTIDFRRCNDNSELNVQIDLAANGGSLTSSIVSASEHR